MSSVLSVSGLVVAPPGAPEILHGVDLEVRAGRRVALVGPSGAGKTTLLRAIAGLEAAQQGEVCIGGVAQADVPAHRRRIAVVFQEPRLLPNLTVEENVALALRAAGTGRAKRRAAAGERLDEVGLDGFAERRVAGPAGGEQQRVALARALCAEPELLLLDEPLTSLDPELREDLRRLITETQTRHGVTTIIVTHDRAEAAELGESVALMLDGRIVQHNEARAMFERPVSAAAARFFGISNLLRMPESQDGEVWAIRPERVALGDGPFRGKVRTSVYRGTWVHLMIDWEGQDVEAMAVPGGAPGVGSTVSFDLPSEYRWLLPDGESL